MKKIIKKYHQLSNFAVKRSKKEDHIYEFSGYASFYNIIDSHSHIIKKGAFGDSIKDPSKVKLLWQHNDHYPIGKLKNITEYDDGLYIEGVIINKLEHGENAANLIKEGIINGLSIGVIIQASEDNEDGTMLLQKLDLREISVVTFPANAKAIIQPRNVFHNESDKSLQQQNEDNVTSIEAKMTYKSEQSNNFNHFLRTNGNSTINFKSFDASTEDAGSSIIRQNLSSKIISNAEINSPIRQLANIQNIAGSSIDFVIEDGNFSSGWVSELSARQDTDNSKLKQKRITIHELYAQPKATAKLIEDSEINFEKWLINQISSSFIRKENESFLLGDGQDKPHGILRNNDIEKISAETKGIISINDILNLINSLDDEYSGNSSLLMNKSTLSAIQNYQDNSGRFIWQPATRDNRKASLFGIPVYTCSFMPQLESASLPIIFGDFNAGYTVLDRHGVKIAKDPYTDKPFIKFYAVKRVGGDVLNSKALKILSL